MAPYKSAHVKCSKCKCMTSVCQKVVANVMLTLNDAYGNVCHGSNYSSFNARRRLLQMLLAYVCVQFKPGQSECYIIEHNPATKYASICSLLHTIANKQNDDVKMDELQ